MPCLAIGRRGSHHGVMIWQDFMFLFIAEHYLVPNGTVNTMLHLTTDIKSLRGLKKIVIIQ